MDNPYQAPAVDTAGPGELTYNGWVRCPQCNSDAVDMPGFTWWGGMLGQKVLTHVECQQCKHRYNGKSGGSNVPGIAAYSIVMGGVFFGLFYALGLFG